jgi:hypothetical protein
MEKLIDSLQNLLSAGWEVLVSVLVLVVPWAPLIAWIAFWLLAVNWEKLYPVFTKGAIIGVLFIGLMAILVWGLIAPPSDGVHHLFGLKTSNFVGKTIYVTMLLTIAALCGSVQLSGACGAYASFPDEVPDDHGHDHSSHDHGHSEHDGHGSVEHSHVSHAH